MERHQTRWFLRLSFFFFIVHELWELRPRDRVSNRNLISVHENRVECEEKENEKRSTRKPGKNEKKPVRLQIDSGAAPD